MRRPNLGPVIRDVSGMEPRPHRWFMPHRAYAECWMCGVPQSQRNRGGTCPIATRLHHYLSKRALRGAHTGG